MKSKLKAKLSNSVSHLRLHCYTECCIDVLRLHLSVLPLGLAIKWKPSWLVSVHQLSAPDCSFYAKFIFFISLSLVAELETSAIYHFQTVLSSLDTPTWNQKGLSSQWALGTGLVTQNSLSSTHRAILALLTLSEPMGITTLCSHPERPACSTDFLPMYSWSWNSSQTQALIPFIQQRTPHLYLPTRWLSLDSEPFIPFSWILLNRLVVPCTRTPLGILTLPQ